MGARQRRPSALSVGLKIAQGWTSVVSAPIPSSKRGGVVGGAADDERKRADHSGLGRRLSLCFPGYLDKP